MHYSKILACLLLALALVGAKDECGGLYRGFQYKITSPNYPHEYPAGRDCEYKLQGDDPSCDQEFHLYFQDFDVKASENCEGDYLQVGQRHVFCGTVVGLRKFTGQNNTLALKFHSDGKDAAKGFKILVTALPCDAKLNPLNNHLNRGLVGLKPSLINIKNNPNDLFHRDIRGDNDDNAKNDSNRSSLNVVGIKNQPAADAASPAFGSSNLMTKENPLITSYLFVPPSEKNPTIFNSNPAPRINNDDFGSPVTPLLSGDFLPPGQSPAKFLSQLSRDKVSPATSWDKSSSVIIPARNYGEPGFGVVDYNIQVGHDCNRHPPSVISGGLSSSFGGGVNNYNLATSVGGLPNPYDVNGNYEQTASLGVAGGIPPNSFDLHQYDQPSPIAPSVIGPPPNAGNINYDQGQKFPVNSNHKLDGNVIYDPRFGLVPQTQYAPGFGGIPEYGGNAYPGVSPNWGNNYPGFLPNLGNGGNGVIVPGSPGFPTYPGYPSYPPAGGGGWGECCRVVSGRRFSIVSPGFPGGNSGPYSCRYTITKASPDVCSLRINLRYFNFGSEDQFCRNGHLEIDGQRICGCRSGQTFLTYLSDFSPKFITVTYAGYPRGRFAGFLIDVYQEPCGFGNGASNPYNYNAGIGGGAYPGAYPGAYQGAYSSNIYAPGLLRRQERTLSAESNATAISPSPLDPLYHKVNKRDLGYVYSKPSIGFPPAPTGGEGPSILEAKSQERFFGAGIGGGNCQSRVLLDWVVASKESILRNVRCSAAGFSTSYPSYNARSYLPPDNAKIDVRSL